MNERYTSPEYNVWSPEHVTPESVRFGSDMFMKQCREIQVDGKDDLEEFQAEHPDDNFVIAGTHFTGLDVHATLSLLGDRFDVQVTGESLAKDIPAVKFMINQIGSDRFTPLDYEQEEGKLKKVGIFNPDNFDDLVEKMNDGRTPWMAIHPYTRERGMGKARTGSVYLAQRTNAWIVPTALYLEGGPMNLETPVDSFGQLQARVLGRTKAHYAVGEPIQFESIPNIHIIDLVVRKMHNDEPVTSEERKQFLEVRQTLKQQAKELALVTAQLLPEKYRGEYSKNA